jgi:SAM-dependent methyltransferase
MRRAVASEKLTSGGGIEIRYFAPWYDAGLLALGSVDMICAQAVLEYVPDLPQTYDRFCRWLAPGGGVSLVIDYRSHGTADTWDGHRAYSDLAWRLMCGKQPYSLNRESHSTHVRLLGEAGLDVVNQVPIRQAPATPRAKLARRFRTLSDDDLSCAGAFIQAVKRPAAAGRPS